MHMQSRQAVFHENVQNYISVGSLITAEDNIKNYFLREKLNFNVWRGEWLGGIMFEATFCSYNVDKLC
jgi:hypothetical protein